MKYLFRLQKNRKSNYLILYGIEDKNRLLSQHWLLTINVFGKEFLSPIDEKLKDGVIVLDYGCGTGIWLYNLSKKYDQSKFYGMDVNMRYITFETNKCIFIKCNLLKEKNTIDNIYFIYQRLLMLSYKYKDWINIITIFYNICNLNGWVEFVEIDPKIYDSDDELKNFVNNSINILEKKGYTTNIFKTLPILLKNQGFDNININCRKLEINNNMFYEDLLILFKSFERLLNTFFKYNNYEKKIEEMFLRNKKAYFIWYNIYAQKNK